MAVTDAMTDLIKSVGELLSSVSDAAYAIVHSFVSGIFNLFAGLYAFLSDLGKGVFDLVGGVGKFIAGNAVIIAILVAAVFAYTRFVRTPQAQGRKPAVTTEVGAGKKTN